MRDEHHNAEAAGGARGVAWDPFLVWVPGSAPGSACRL